MATVTIYSTNGCPFCERAKAFLKERGIHFEGIEARQGSAEWAAMVEKTGTSSVPQILVQGEPIGGYGDLVGLDANGELYRMLGLKPPEAITSIYDVIIIGAGPAGLSAALYCARKLLKTLLISKDLGGQVSWTYDVDNYLGFSQVEAADLIAKFEEHVDKFGLEKRLGVGVKSLDLGGKLKKVTTAEEKTYTARTMIIATGKRPRPLGVPGEKKFVGVGVTYCSTCDAPLFAGLDVAVAGGGNSALEAVIDLIKVARKVYLVSLGPLTGEQVLQEKVTGSPKVEVFTEHRIVRIAGETNVEGIEIEPVKDKGARRLAVSGIIVEIGLLPNSELVIDTLQTNRVGEIVVDARCRTGVAGVFACGDVTDVPFKQVVVAAGEGAKAALSAYDYIINQR